MYALYEETDWLFFCGIRAASTKTSKTKDASNRAEALSTLYTHKSIKSPYLSLSISFSISLSPSLSLSLSPFLSLEV